MSDAELFLLGWAVIATVKAFEYRAKEKLARGVFMHLIRDEKARNKMVADWEAFKRANNVREGV
jgi:hypothetical protein